MTYLTKAVEIVYDGLEYMLQVTGKVLGKLYKESPDEHF